MKALVTGGAGFLGTEIVRQLVERNFHVDIVDINVEDEYKQVKVYDIDLSDEGTTKDFFKQANYDYIYHLAAISDLEKAEESFQSTFQNNVTSTINIIEQMKNKNNTKLIFSSSMYVFGERGGNYRLSKQICELIIQELTKKYKLSSSIIRFGSIYGPGSTKENGLFKIVHDALCSPEIVYEGAPNSMRQYVHIKDAARECIEIAQSQQAGVTFHLITGDQVFRMEDVFCMINEILGQQKETRYLGKTNEGHFSYTPFTFKAAPAVKNISISSVDFGQGLWELINYVSQTVDKTKREDAQ